MIYLKKDVKIFLIINLIAVSILVPSIIYYFGYYQYQQNQNQNMQLNLTLFPLIWTVRIEGTAINQPQTFTIIEFQRYSNVTNWMRFKTSSEDTWHFFTGFALKTLVHNIMNVTSYTEVVIKAIDGWQISYSQADVDYYNEDILLVYLQDGFPILKKELGGDGPVRTIVSQYYCTTKYGDDFNGRLCAKYVMTIEIN